MEIKRIPDQILLALKILEENGHDAYIVGGCVRDRLLGKQPNDWDITTSALPDMVMQCFCNFKVIETGLKHGTVTVLINKMHIEITTFRVDGEYVDGRRPENVLFTSSIEHDLSRRDFTINAMAYNPQKGLVDNFGGINDLKSKIIKCVGNAVTRFEEDALRILRMFRFAAQLSFDIDQESLEAASQCRSMLEKISKERVSSELNKILLSDNPQKVLNLLVDYGIMELIIPQFQYVIDFDQKSKHHDRKLDRHIIDAVCFANNDLVTRLALLLHDIGKPDTFTIDEKGNGHCYGHDIIGAEMSAIILKNLKYDNKTICSVYNLILNHDKVFDTKYKVGKLIDKLGDDDFFRLVELKYADTLSHANGSINYRLELLDKMVEIAGTIFEEQGTINIKGLNISGDDIMQLGIKQGKNIGYILNQLLNMVMNEEIENNHTKLAEKANEIIEKENLL